MSRPKVETYRFQASHGGTLHVRQGRYSLDTEAARAFTVRPDRSLFTAKIKVHQGAAGGRTVLSFDAESRRSHVRLSLTIVAKRIARQFT